MSGLEDSVIGRGWSSGQIFLIYLHLDKKLEEDNGLGYIDLDTYFEAYGVLRRMSLPKKMGIFRRFKGDLRREYRDRFLVL